jgi:hypothetical protein
MMAEMWVVLMAGMTVLVYTTVVIRMVIVEVQVI